MSSEDLLMRKLGEYAQNMAGKMPTDPEPVLLNIGEINMVIKALMLLRAVRIANSYS